MQMLRASQYDLVPHAISNGHAQERKNIKCIGRRGNAKKSLAKSLTAAAAEAYFRVNESSQSNPDSRDPTRL